MVLEHLLQLAAGVGLEGVGAFVTQGRGQGACTALLMEVEDVEGSFVLVFGKFADIA